MSDLEKLKGSIPPIVTPIRDGQIDFLLLKNQLRYELRQLDYREKRNSQIMEFVPFWDDVVGLEESRRRFERVQPAKTAGQLADKFENVGCAWRVLKAKAQLGPPGPSSITRQNQESCLLLTDAHGRLPDNGAPNSSSQ